MMMKALMMKALLVTITVALLSAPAVAEDVRVAMRPVTSFGYLDRDKDARLTPAEAKADWAVAQGFERADANGDGLLDKDEFATLTKG